MRRERTFAGFPPDALRFLAQLAIENDRAWFAANKDRYERSVAEPMRAFVADATRELAAAGIPIGGDAKRSIFRIYRDVRFARDKRPYRTHAACYLSYDGGRETQGGLYVHIAPGNAHLSVPFYLVPPPMLRRWRTAMRDDPARFKRVVRLLAAKGLRIDPPEASDDALRRLPRGFADVAGTALEPFFKLRSFSVERPLTRAEVTSATLLDAAVRIARDAKPLLDYGWSLD